VNDDLCYFFWGWGFVGSYKRRVYNLDSEDRRKLGEWRGYSYFGEARATSKILTSTMTMQVGTTTVSVWALFINSNFTGILPRHSFYEAPGGRHCPV
jgi:hypothetical protein